MSWNPPTHLFLLSTLIFWMEKNGKQKMLTKLQYFNNKFQEEDQTDDNSSINNSDANGSNIVKNNISSENNHTLICNDIIETIDNFCNNIKRKMWHVKLNQLNAQKMKFFVQWLLVSRQNKIFKQYQGNTSHNKWIKKSSLKCYWYEHQSPKTKKQTINKAVTISYQSDLFSIP